MPPPNDDEVDDFPNNDEVHDFPDDFFDNLAEALSGNYFYTCYCYSTSIHKDIFRLKTVKAGFTWALYLTIFTVMLDLGSELARLSISTDSENDIDIVLIAKDPKEGHLVDHISGLQNLWSGNEAQVFVHGQGQDKVLNGKQSNGSSSGSLSYFLSNAAYQILLRYMLFTVVCFGVQLLAALGSILYNLVLRWIIASYKNSLIAGLIRLRRVTGNGVTL
ncbi:hypothetical protein Ocin01_09510 [Orchesella cincta]|uniref:Uncharacterized protein n=1 Tax=Orchesella cincta TaxID=48709 RepID=A0A1D2MVY4_ORCCI|nr:hypothetical protein Ocin01_09510 [Orchesella cincta]